MKYGSFLLSFFYFIFSILISFSIVFPEYVFASASAGAVSTIQNNTACFLNTAYGCINFGLTQGNVTIIDSQVTGDAWSNYFGWINLFPSSSNTAVGVHNDSNGNLSGYAWGEKTGWINFNPTNANTRVTIDTAGDFHGYAWSENYGWLSFNCNNDNSCGANNFKVSTDWRPPSVRNSNQNNNPSPSPSPSPSASPSSSPSPSESPSPSPSGEPGISSSPSPSPIGNPGTPPEITPPNNPPPNSGGGSAPTASLSPINTLATQANNIISTVSSIAVEQTKVIVDNATKAIAKTAEVTTQVVTSVPGQVATKVISTTGVVVTTAVTVPSIFFSSFSLSELVFVPLRLWALLLAAFGLKKRRRPWGTVYDSVTKQPLDPAYVILDDQNGQSVTEAITDIDGRYGFVTPTIGMYTIVANKTHYQFPSQKLSGRTSDELYSDLYFGEPIAIREEGSVIVKNIPLDPIGFDWNEFAKGQQKLTRFYSRRDRLVRKLTDWFFRIGFAVTIISTIILPVPYNFAMFALYIILAILRIAGVGKKTFGHVFEKNTGMALPYAVVRIFDEGDRVPRFSKVCDKIGRYYALVPNGRYYATVEKKNLDESYTLIYTSPTIVVTTGIINTTFEV